MKLSLEVKTAILVILGILFFIFGYNYLKGKNLLEIDNTYYTSFDFNGLKPSSPVTIKGNNIGKITDIKYDFSTGETRVAFTVNPQLKFSKNSTVRMYQEGLMGGNALAIIPAEGGELAKPGDFIKSDVEKSLVESLSSNFSGLSSDLDSTIKSADSLLLGLNKIVYDESHKGLKNGIFELNKTLIAFKELSYSINGLVKNNDEKIAELLKNFEVTSKNLAKISTDLDQSNLAGTVAKLDSAMVSLNTIMTDVEKGKGSLGKLLNDDKLYNNLEGATSQLEQLLQDFKLNPKRYVHFSVFGKKAKQYDADGNEIKDKK